MSAVSMQSSGPPADGGIDEQPEPGKQGGQTEQSGQSGDGGQTEQGIERSDRYLTFHLGTEVFAVGILDITEIIAFRPLTGVPMMPEFIRGVLNLRGVVVPVVDLGVRFGGETTQTTDRAGIIIVETDAPQGGDGRQRFGIMVDAVNEVMQFGPDDIEPAPALGNPARWEFISGMAKRGEEFVIVLDIFRVLQLDGPVFTEVG